LVFKVLWQNIQPPSFFLRSTRTPASKACVSREKLQACFEIDTIFLDLDNYIEIVEISNRKNTAEWGEQLAVSGRNLSMYNPL